MKPWLVLGQTAKFKERQYFWLYGVENTAQVASVSHLAATQYMAMYIGVAKPLYMQVEKPC